ncbi:hypothetical protein NAT51_14990 [Flavobacterium amniphilum]|uniref:hypothetical protein n=1 Tax=Flavobacterium amniphilum TaxID=1834035 RepID=UPI002029F5DA|nr:hypothetical protein [Flavobacterium amniphilum]MCL9806839.1 hypothetical protein [Flavobacterium amniphilum]
MKPQITLALLLFFASAACFSQQKESKTKNQPDKILTEFPIPYEGDSIPFKKLKTADEYFYSAAGRTKRLKNQLDSTAIYTAIREYQYSVKLDKKHWASYRNLARLFMMTNRKELALLSLDRAIQYSGREDRSFMVKMKDDILNGGYK